MASFASISFEERGAGSGAAFPVHGVKARFAILPVPGGTRVFLQKLGYDAAPLDVPARVTAAQLASLRAKVAQSGSLVYAGGTITATLVDVDGPAEVKRDVDYYFVVLKFVVPW